MLLFLLCLKLRYRLAISQLRSFSVLCFFFENFLIYEVCADILFIIDRNQTNDKLKSIFIPDFLDKDYTNPSFYFFFFFINPSFLSLVLSVPVPLPLSLSSLSLSLCYSPLRSRPAPRVHAVYVSSTTTTANRIIWKIICGQKREKRKKKRTTKQLITLYKALMKRGIHNG